MIWFKNWKYILRHDRALIWPYLKINVRRVFYWGSLAPVMIPLFVIGVIALILQNLAALVDAIFEGIGAGLQFALRESGYMNFIHKTDDCYHGLADRAFQRRKERENES